MERLELKVDAVRLKDSGFLPIGSSSVGAKNSPIYITVDTGFDYSGAVTAFIGFLVAVVVARFTASVQRNQIQANISNFRHQWMVELRESASELIQLFVVMINKSAKSVDYRNNGDYVLDRSRAAQLRSKIDLLLSRNDENTNTLRRMCGDLLDDINSMVFGADAKPLVDKLVYLQDMIRSELENAWSDTKTDLGIDKRGPWYDIFRKT